ncbi:MAG: metal-sulfur cluster assembly factor, partial [Lentisphaerae bacterium]
SKVQDPDLHMAITDLGLVYEVNIEGSNVSVDMTLTSPGCPYGPMMVEDARKAVAEIPGVEEARINLVWDPPWTIERIPPEVRLDLGLDY